MDPSTILCNLILSSAIMRRSLATLAQFIAVLFAYDRDGAVARGLVIDSSIPGPKDSIPNMVDSTKRRTENSKRLSCPGCIIDVAGPDSGLVIKETFS